MNEPKKYDRFFLVVGLNSRLALSEGALRLRRKYIKKTKFFAEVLQSNLSPVTSKKKCIVRLSTKLIETQSLRKVKKLSYFSYWKQILYLIKGIHSYSVLKGE